jgi:hypothetical protein
MAVSRSNYMQLGFRVEEEDSYREEGEDRSITEAAIDATRGAEFHARY